MFYRSLFMINTLHKKSTIVTQQWYDLLALEKLWQLAQTIME